MKKFDLYNENRSESPKIDSGFKVPDGYFESFGERLQLRLETEKPLVTPRGIVYYLKPVLGIAAGLAIFVTVYLHYPTNLKSGNEVTFNLNDSIQQSDRSEQVINAVTSLISDGQFFSALNDMDEYDASIMPKEALADYLASNCSDFEILNANK